MLRELKKELEKTLTVNGATTYKSSNQSILDYFAVGSALRNREKSSIIELFNNSFEEDKLLTLKILFNSRDIRGGNGERETFRTILKYLGSINSQELRKNIHLIPYYGRWDDLYALVDTPLWLDAINFINTQLMKDINSQKPSVLAKWLKSENASSLMTKYYAYITRTDLGLNSKEYRKLLSNLRKRINIIEHNISSKDYDIDYSKVPSQASLKYSRAFMRNDEKGYSSYLEKLSAGKTKVNAKTLNPGQLVQAALELSNCDNYGVAKSDPTIYNNMWDALPNYIGEDTENSLAVIDVSGSMEGAPLNMAIGLGLYLAEKNNGHFEDHFITFSEDPELVKISGDTFVEKVKNISMSNWGYSTNIKAVFDLILNTAKKYELSNKDLPSRIFIITDMEFDSIDDYNKGYSTGYLCGFNTPQRNTLFETISLEYSDAGYKMPKLVFWNVNSVSNNIPMREEDNVQLVSGPNPVLFETLLKGEFLSATDIMLNVLNRERYDLITL